MDRRQLLMGKAKCDLIVVRESTGLNGCSGCMTFLMSSLTPAVIASS